MTADLKGKRVLVIGSGLSGVGSVKLLDQIGALPVMLEENTSDKFTVISTHTLK